MEQQLTPADWTTEFLEESRFRMDPLADDFVKELADTKSRKEIYTIMQYLLQEYVWLDHEDMDEPSKEFIKKACTLPSWADVTLIKRAEKFFAMHSPEISMVLLLKALPSTYCCWRGTEVIHRTGRLTEHSGNMKAFTRRLMETSKFVLNVLSKDGLVNKEGLMNDGVGLKATVKVRTLHAFIRHFIYQTPEEHGALHPRVQESQSDPKFKMREWNTEYYGAPINQEDYAGTMLAFSVFVIEGLEQMGIKVSDKDKEAYFHIWRIIAHIIGVEEKLIAADYGSGTVLGHAILDHQKGPSTAGEELTKACLDFLKTMMPRFLHFLPDNMMYFMMGPELSQMVGVKQSKKWILRFTFKFFLTMIKFTEWCKNHIGLIRWMAIKFNPKVLDLIIRKFLKESGSKFTPKEVQASLNKMMHDGSKKYHA